MWRLLLLALLVGCDQFEFGDTYTTKRTDNRCADDTVESRADFTLQCIENANPKSDEEPEDWILKCQTMATNLYCPKVSVLVDHQCLLAQGCSSIYSMSEIETRPADSVTP